MYRVVLHLKMYCKGGNKDGRESLWCQNWWWKPFDCRNAQEYIYFLFREYNAIRNNFFWPMPALGCWTIRWRATQYRLVLDMCLSSSGKTDMWSPTIIPSRQRAIVCQTEAGCNASGILGNNVAGLHEVHSG